MLREKEELLIVDDIEINRQILQDVFAEEYNICEAENGLQAWELLNHSCSRFTAVIMDYNMPVMDGLEVLTKINHIGMTKYLPVFIVTGNNDNELLEDAYSLGAADVVFKPYSIAVFKRRFAKIKELYEQRNELNSIVQNQSHELNRISQQQQLMFDILDVTSDFRQETCIAKQRISKVV